MHPAFLSRVAAIALIIGLAGCGFHLRGAEPLPFKSAFVEAGAQSALAPLLNEAFKEQGKLAPTADEAVLRVRLTSESRNKTILTLSGAGRVLEYRLEYKVTASVADTFGVEVAAPFTIQLTSDFSYSDEQVLAKQAEEATLYRAMEQEALRQIVRRLSYLKHT